MRSLSLRVLPCTVWASFTVGIPCTLHMLQERTEAEEKELKEYVSHISWLDGKIAEANSNAAAATA